MKRFVWVGFLLLVTGVVTVTTLLATEDPMALGTAAYLERDYAKALTYFGEEAENGNSAAQYLLGKMYAGGLGVKKDDRIAVEWLEKAAEQGHADAQYLVARKYEDGRKGGVPKNDQLAVKWLEAAAGQGHANAQNRLGEIYFEGRSIEKNLVQAFKWLFLASKQGDTIAAETIKKVREQLSSGELEEAAELLGKPLAELETP